MISLINSASVEYMNGQWVFPQLRPVDGVKHIWWLGQLRVWTAHTLSTTSPETHLENTRESTVWLGIIVGVKTLTDETPRKYTYFYFYMFCSVTAFIIFNAVFIFLFLLCLSIVVSSFPALLLIIYFTSFLVCILLWFSFLIFLVLFLITLIWFLGLFAWLLSGFLFWVFFVSFFVCVCVF